MTRDAAWREFNRRLDKAGEVVGAGPMEREQFAAVEWYRSQVARECMREQTAATILAATVDVSSGLTDGVGDYERTQVRFAVHLADELRAALEGT